MLNFHLSLGLPSGLCHSDFLACVDYTASNGNTVQYELERICKETIIAHIMTLLRRVSARILETVSNLGRIRSLDRDLNLGPPKYESTVITIRECRMVIMIMALFRGVCKFHRPAPSPPVCRAKKEICDSKEYEI
jgi:hypothetical protein